MATVLWNTKAYWEQSHKKEGIPWLLQTLANQQDVEDPLINAWLLVARTPTVYSTNAYLQDKSDRYRTIVTLVREHAQWLNDNPKIFDRIAAAIDFDAPRIESSSIMSRGLLALKLIDCQQMENTWEPLKQKHLVQCVIDWINAETLVSNNSYPGLTLHREDVLVLMTSHAHANSHDMPSISRVLGSGQEYPLSEAHYRHVQRIDAIVENDSSFNKQYPYMTMSLKLYRPFQDVNYHHHNQWMERHGPFIQDTALALSKMQHSKPEDKPTSLLYLIASQQYPMYSKIDGAVQALRDVSNTLSYSEVWSKNATQYIQNSAWCSNSSSRGKLELWLEELNDLYKIHSLLEENKPQILPDLGRFDLT